MLQPGEFTCAGTTSSRRGQRSVRNETAGGILTVSLDHVNKFNLLSRTGLGAASIYGDEEVVASNVYELLSEASSP